MRIIFAAVIGAIVIAVGVFGGLFLWDGYRTPSAELVEWCKLRAEYWARARAPSLMEPECVEIGIYPR